MCHPGHRGSSNQLLEQYTGAYHVIEHHSRAIHILLDDHGGTDDLLKVCLWGFGETGGHSGSQGA